MAKISGELGRFIESLAENGVDFVICGGIACILQGVSRTTADLDIALRMERANLERLLPVAADFHLAPRAPEPISALLDESRRRVWIDQKGAKVFTLVSTTTPLQVDIILEYPIQYDELQEAADVFHVAGRPFKASSKQDLVRAKRVVSPVRTADLRDIEDLEELIRRERE